MREQAGVGAKAITSEQRASPKNWQGMNESPSVYIGCPGSLGLNNPKDTLKAESESFVCIGSFFL